MLLSLRPFVQLPS